MGLPKEDDDGPVKEALPPDALALDLSQEEPIPSAPPAGLAQV